MTNHISKIQSDNVEIIARHRIDSGYYNSPAVIDETVRRLHASLLDEQIAAEAADQEAFDATVGDRWENQS